MNLSFGASGDLSSLRGVQASFLRPLSAIAATRGGAVPQARIARILADLAGLLAAFIVADASTARFPATASV